MKTGKFGLISMFGTALISAILAGKANAGSIEKELSSLPVNSNYNTRENYDPNNTGNLLYNIKDHLDDSVSPHFKLKEFAYTDGKYQDNIRLDEKLVSELEELRNAIGKSIKITSGFRSYGRQMKLEGAKKSRHCSGQAVDIKVNGMSGKELAQIARKTNPKGGIGISKKWIHFDVRNNPATWYYGSVKK